MGRFSDFILGSWKQAPLTASSKGEPPLPLNRPRVYGDSLKEHGHVQRLKHASRDLPMTYPSAVDLPAPDLPEALPE
jgi:hypothetical protein